MNPTCEACGKTYAENNRIGCDPCCHEYISTDASVKWPDFVSRKRAEKQPMSVPARLAGVTVCASEIPVEHGGMKK
jgi:hypothetical protein